LLLIADRLVISCRCESWRTSRSAATAAAAGVIEHRVRAGTGR